MLAENARSQTTPAGGSTAAATLTGGLPGLPHFPPKAKRAIYLFMNGGPSQMDLFDYKPKMDAMFDKDLPDSIRNGPAADHDDQRPGPVPDRALEVQVRAARPVGHVGQRALALDGQARRRDRAGEDGLDRGDQPRPGGHLYLHGQPAPGPPQPGLLAQLRPGHDEPEPAGLRGDDRVVVEQGRQAIYNRLWGAGFLPSKHQGVALRSKGDPVLFLSNPDGVDAATRRRTLDAIDRLNQHEFEQFADPETQARIAQYEMAFRMQTSVPELADISREPQHILDLYGPDVHKPGTFARCCLLARRLAERDVRFVQIFHRGWDQHGNLAGDLPRQCQDVDQATFALVTDLKQRGLLDDTLVIWGGEFGRTIYCQGKLTRDNYGRDHHPKCFPLWMAGGGIKPGVVYGETDDFSYNVVDDPVHIHDLNATILHCLGIDHRRLSFKFQGLDVRLTGVEEHHPVKGILA